MPIARFEMPDGRIARLEVPDGTSPEQAQKMIEAELPNLQASSQPEEPKSNINDAQAGLIGAAQGASAGWGDELLSGLAAGGAKVLDALQVDRLLTGKELDKSLGDIYSENMAKNRADIQDASQNHKGAYITGNVVGAVGTGLAGGATKAGAAANNWLRGGNLLTRAGKGALAGGASGAAYGAGSAEDGKRLEGAMEGAALGAATGGVLPVVGAGLNKAKEAILPQIDDAIKPLAQRARDLGIPLRLDQVSPTRARKTVQKVSQEIPFSGVDSFEAGQRASFNRAIAKTIGQESDDLGPETIKKFLSDADNKFSQAFKGKQFQFNKLDQKQLNNIALNADDMLTEDVAKIVRKQVAKLSSDIPPDGMIAGEKLASLRSNLIKNTAKIDPQAKSYVGDLIDFIDSVAGDQMQKADADILQQARREWRNFRTLEPLLEKTTDGMINPTELMQKVASSPYIRASRIGVGEDDLVDLARIGKTFLPKAGGSDTFQKTALGAAGASALYNPSSLVVTGGTMLGNRGFQAVNQSQKLVEKALKQGAKSPLSINSKMIPAIGATGARSGAAQSGATGGMMPPQVSNEVPQPEQNAAATPNDLLNRIAMAESGGDPNAVNSRTGATGVFQYMPKTWQGVVRNYGKELGLTMGDFKNPEAQALATQTLIEREYLPFLTKELGREPNAGEIYLAHFAGQPAAKKLLRSNPRIRASSVLPSVAKDNPEIFFDGKRPRTVAEVMQVLAEKVA